VLAEMWAELLRCERVGIDDDFFDLGGDSLLAVQLMARLRATFPADLTASALFRSSTVEQLAQSLVAHETRPGEMEKTAAILLRVRSLSPEERQRLLAAKSGALKERQPT
jgi:acyl carrier protein